MAALLLFCSTHAVRDAGAQAPSVRAWAGLERTVDTSIAPGDDFFAYANGAWLRSAVIPAGRDRWTVRDDLDERARRQVAALLDDARRAPPGSLARMVADFRASLLDSARIEARGLAPLAPELERIARIGDRRSLARALGAGMQADVDPLNLGVYASASVLGLAVEHSIHGETSYDTFLVQGGLGLGGRDAYLATGTDSDERRRRYQRYVARLLALAGFDESDRRAESVLALETALATSHATSEASAMDRNADTIWTRDDLAREAPGMDWAAFLDAAGLGAAQRIVPWQPSAVRGVAAAVASQSLEAWKDYLRFHLIDDYAGVLPRAIADAAAEQRGDRRSRDVRAAELTRSAMSGAIGELYAARHFSPAQKARVRSIVANVAAAYRERVAHAAWSSPASRTIALAKLDALYVGIGYPETREDWSDLHIDAGDALGNVRRIEERARRHALARLAVPYDPHEWVIPPQAVGAVLVFQQNAYEFAAGLLQPPKYDSTESDAAAYGAIGAIIGHDISHFVDVLGANYEPDGRMRRWWTAADSTRFEQAAEPLVRQFSEYEPLPGMHVDGRRTRTENVADLAGLAAAFDAHRKALGAGVARDVVRRADREFFIAFAQAFAAKTNEKALRAQLAGDHAPEAYRMDTVRNLDAWYDAFDVVPGQRLYLAPSARVRVW
jgi:endothelin-converting enzyme/putative endopeptidase